MVKIGVYDRKEIYWKSGLWLSVSCSSNQLHPNMFPKIAARLSHIWYQVLSPFVILAESLLQ
jgi:hypothetical protein